MTERDPLGEVLREWQAVEPGPAFDERVLLAYRAERNTLWHRMWRARISVPVPIVVLAALVLAALVFWYRLNITAPAVGAGIVTQVDSNGFRALPNGAARVISVRDLHK